MKWLLLLFLLALLIANVHAQAPSPIEQALNAKLGSEIGLGLKCTADLIAAQLELAKAQARIKELEEAKK